MTTTILRNETKLTLEIFTIDEAVKAKRLTKQEGIEYHDWVKGSNSPVDQKHFIYVEGQFAGIAYNKPSTEEAVEIAKDTIEYLS